MPLCVAACALAVCGCSSKPALDLYPVESQVSLNGKPLEQGSISLYALDGIAANYCPTGRIGAEGRAPIFTAGKPGCPAGKFKVVVFATETAEQAGDRLPTSIINRRYNSAEFTPLTMEVVASKEPALISLRLDK